MNFLYWKSGMNENEMQRRSPQFEMQLMKASKNFRPAGIQPLTSVIPVQHSNIELASQLGVIIKLAFYLQL